MKGHSLGDFALATAGHPAGVPTIHRCQLGLRRPRPFSNLYPSLAFPMPPPSPMTFIADRHLFMQINSTTDLLIVLSFSDK